MIKLPDAVKIGQNAVIEEGAIVGEGDDSLGELVIGDNAIIRSGTVIYYGSKIGNNFRTGHNAVIREKNLIGDNVSVGSLSEMGPCNKIGDYTSIHSGCFLERATIGDYVFIAPGVKFLDDRFPVDPNQKNWKGAIIGNDVAIGGGSIIGPGIKIGNNVLIGMGSVVTKDVPDGEMWCGNPARYVREVRDIKYENSPESYVPGNKKRYMKSN